jgi:hypothetical protein
MRSETIAVASVILVASSLGSVLVGQDLNWDLRNYHFYNGYAFLGERLGQDIAPAGPQTYFNPLLDVFHYIGIRHLPPWVFGALLGAIQGLNLVLIWAMARAMLGPVARWLAPLAALLGGTGQNYVSLLGSTMGDTTASIPALVGVLALVSSEGPGLRRVVLAGFAGGLAVGLKLTMVVPHAGLALLAGLVAWRQRRPDLAVGFALGSLAGWSLTGGWWSLQLWERFANPVFPLANGVFQSPFGPPYSFHLEQWSPQTPWDWLGGPLDAALGRNERLQEVPLRDPRLLVVWIALGAWLLTALRRLRRGESVRMPGRGLALYWLGTYSLWFTAFHYYRYAAVLELLAAVLALVLLADICPRRLAVAAPTLAVAILLSTSVGHWGRRAWADSWVAPELPPLAERPNQLVFLPHPTTSYAIPFFPADSTFIGTFWNFGPAMWVEIRARLESHQGPVLMLALPPRRRAERTRVLGLAVEGSCERIDFGGPDRLFLCPLSRSPSEELE